MAVHIMPPHGADSSCNNAAAHQQTGAVGSMQHSLDTWHERTPASSSGVVLAGSQQAPGKGYLELALDPDINRTGDVWHLCLPGLRDAAQLCFGWRADSASCTEFVPGVGHQRLEPP